MRHVRVVLVIVVLALGATSCSSSTAGIEAAGDDSDAAAAVDEAPATAEPTATTAPTATAEPEPTEVPEPTPEPTEVPEPTAEPAETESESVACLERLAAGDGELLVALADSDTDSLSALDDEQLDKLATFSVDCGIVEESLGTTDDVTVALAVPCLNELLVSEGGGRLFVALAALGEQVPVPEALRPLFVDSMDDCLGASVMADAIVGEAELDPAMVGVFDRDCLEREFEETGSIRAIWEQVAEDPQVDANNAGAEAAVGPTVRCASMGAIIAAAAAEEGVDLGPETIACIDEKAQSIDMTDAAAEDDFGVAMLSCMSEDELGEFVGSG